MDWRAVMRTWSTGTRISRPASVTSITSVPCSTGSVATTAVPLRRGDKVTLAMPSPPRPLTR